jgi:hypothetical protein
MPKQQTIVDAISENLEELRTLIDENAYTYEDADKGQSIINNTQTLLIQLQ